MYVSPSKLAATSSFSGDEGRGPVAQNINFQCFPESRQFLTGSQAMKSVSISEPEISPVSRNVPVGVNGECKLLEKEGRCARSDRSICEASDIAERQFLSSSDGPLSLSSIASETMSGTHCEERQFAQYLEQSEKAPFSFKGITDNGQLLNSNHTALKCQSTSSSEQANQSWWKSNSDQLEWDNCDVTNSCNISFDGQSFPSSSTKVHYTSDNSLQAIASDSADIHQNEQSSASINFCYRIGPRTPPEVDMDSENMQASHESEFVQDMTDRLLFYSPLSVSSSLGGQGSFDMPSVTSGSNSFAIKEKHLTENSFTTRPQLITDKCGQKEISSTDLKMREHPSELGSSAAQKIINIAKLNAAGKGSSQSLSDSLTASHQSAAEKYISCSIPHSTLVPTSFVTHSQKSAAEEASSIEQASELKTQAALKIALPSQPTQSLPSSLSAQPDADHSMGRLVQQLKVLLEQTAQASLSRAPQSKTRKKEKPLMPWKLRYWPGRPVLTTFMEHNPEYQRNPLLPKDEVVEVTIDGLDPRLDLDRSPFVPAGRSEQAKIALKERKRHHLSSKVVKNIPVEPRNLEGRSKPKDPRHPFRSLVAEMDSCST